MVRERIDAAVENHPIYDSNTAAIGALPARERDSVVRFYRTLDRVSDEHDPTTESNPVKLWAYTCELRADEAIDALKSR